MRQLTEISGLPGFRDFYPEELALRSHLFTTWRDVASRYGFSEYDGPPLESLELYVRKSGPEIIEQLYAFEDKGGREVALRPEMTPSFARMISARAAALPKPIRWFSIPQLFRYERPQKGRLREHFQLNMDIVGESGILADVEVVAAGLDVLRALGLGSEDVEARVSDRRLIAAVLRSLGVPDDRMLETFGILDRAGREGADWLVDRMRGMVGSDDAAARIGALADCDLSELTAAHASDQAVERAADDLDAFFSHLDAYGLGDFVRFDAGLVRGLAYYTGTVFEFWQRGGELRAICGGGRYDDLLAALGGVELPAVGFGMGDVVLGEILKDRGLVPTVAGTVDDFLVIVATEQRPLALELASGLRKAGRRVVFDLRERSVGRQFKAADQAGAERAVVLGPDEAARGVVRVRWLESGEEKEMTAAELVGS